MKSKSIEKQYVFSTDWFSKNIPIWQEKLKEYKGQPNIKYLELGVSEGRSFIWVLENILTHPTSQATGIDYFPGNLFDKFNYNLKILDQNNKIKVMKGKFNQVLYKLPKENFDIIYLDGGHMAWSTLETTHLAWPLLKTNGILIFDDYLFYDKIWPPQYTPKLAIDSFIEVNKRHIEVEHTGYQVIIRKIKTSCDSLNFYACTPIAHWSYDWSSKTLFNSTNKKLYKIKEKQFAELEKVLKKYNYQIGAKEFDKLVLADPSFKQLILKIQNVQ